MSGPTESELQLQIHQRLLDELSQGHQAFETHIDLLEDVIFRCTRSGVFTLLNPAWARLLGWSVDTTLGTPITEFMADQDAAAALLQAMAQNDSISCDVKLGSRYGLTRQFRLRAKFNGEWYGSLQDVTDMLNVIAELHESQRQSRKLSQVASRTDNLVIITDADGVIEWVNQSFETVTGYTMSEVRGRRPGDFLQGANTPAQTIRLMSEGIRNAKGFTAEVINYTKAGKPYWISIDCSPVFDRDNKLINFIAIERDISEQKNLENLLRENEQRYRNVLNSVSEPIFQCDANLGITFANKAWSQFVGRSDAETSQQGSCLSDFVSADQRPLLEAAVHKAFESEQSVRQELIFAIQGKPPRRVELIFSNSVNQLDNERRCLTGALVDIEEQWQINQEILKAKQNAEELSQARTRFVANMSHEIRTPLNSIIGMTSVLEQSGLSEKQQSCLEAIKKGGHALLAVINDILDFAKLDYGEQEIEKIEFSWHELFEDVVDMLAADIEAKNLLFTLSCDSQIPETFVGDLHKLRRVLTNLLSNAIKFTSAGEISVTTLWTSDSDSAALDSEHSGWLTFCVSDSGIGIEPSRLQALFDPFTQADASVTRNYGGTGLGLAICKQICHSLGGAITVESVLNQGTKMTVKIPLSVSRGAADSASTACHRAIQAINARPRTIKVVSSLGLLQELPVRVERNAKSGSSVRMITDETGFKPLQMEHEPAIYTPRRLQQRLQPQREGATKKQPAPTITRPLKILVAEDSKANQVVIKALLEHQGYLDVTLVNNGQEALDKFAEDPAELVLVDIHMPVMDGFTTSKTIREHKDWPQPVIYALTADVTTEAIAAAQAHGIDLWVTKPVTGEALRQALDKYPGFVDEAARADRITL